MRGSVLLCEKTTQRRCWGRRGFVRAARHAGRESVAYSYELLTMVFKRGFRISASSASGLPSAGTPPKHLPSFPAEILLWQKHPGKGTVPVEFGEFTLPWPSHCSHIQLILRSVGITVYMVLGGSQRPRSAVCWERGSGLRRSTSSRSYAWEAGLAKQSCARSKASLVENTTEETVVLIGSVKSRWSPSLWIGQKVLNGGRGVVGLKSFPKALCLSCPSELWSQQSRWLL